MVVTTSWVVADIVDGVFAGVGAGVGGGMHLVQMVEVRVSYMVDTV